MAIVSEKPKPPQVRGNSARIDMVVGGLLCAVGIIGTVVTFSIASKSGGTVVVAWGAILFGGFRFLRGLARIQR